MAEEVPSEPADRPNSSQSAPQSSRPLPLQAAAPAYEPDFLDEKRTIFALFDRAQEGTIDLEQVGPALRGMGLCPTEKELRDALAAFAPHAKVAFEEFLPVFEKLEQTQVAVTRDEFMDGLQHFDAEGTGRIKVAELRHILTTLGERLTPAEVEQLLGGMGDEEGMVRIEDFVRIVTQ